jgi:hypothetical protein
MYIGVASLIYESRFIDATFAFVVRLYFAILLFSFSQFLYSLLVVGNPRDCGGVITGDDIIGKA